MQVMDDSSPPASGPRTRFRRGVDSASLTMLLPLLFLLSLALSCAWVFAAIGAAVLGVTPGALIAIWLAGAALLFVPPCERALAIHRLHYRRPTAQEAERLEAAFAPVRAAAGLAHGRFTLLIEDSPQPNASAAFAHIIAVTTDALRLPTGELQGVLAHELGHHARAHVIPLTLAVYLVLPIQALVHACALMAGALNLVARMAQMMRNGPVSLVASLFAFAVQVQAWFTALLARAATAALVPICRYAEYGADQTAVGLGFGPQLRAALERARAFEEPQAGMFAATHPPLEMRIARIERSLEA
jgi:Zn-dependent protease with chaperone function